MKKSCPLKFTDYTTERRAQDVANMISRQTDGDFQVTKCRLCKGWHVNRVLMAEIGERAK